MGHLFNSIPNRHSDFSSQLRQRQSNFLTELTTVLSVVSSPGRSLRIPGGGVTPERSHQVVLEELILRRILPRRPALVFLH